MADQDRRTLLAGALLGAGVAASVVDLAVFHLLLHWHHFYDLSTTGVALASDGLFHAFGWFTTVGSLFLLADLRRRGARVLDPLGRGPAHGPGRLPARRRRGHCTRCSGSTRSATTWTCCSTTSTWTGTAALALAAGLLLVRRTRPGRPGAMSPPTTARRPAGPLVEGTALLLLLLAAAGYAAGLRAARRRGPWPVHRTVLWCAGLLCAGTHCWRPWPGPPAPGSPRTWPPTCCWGWPRPCSWCWPHPSPSCCAPCRWPAPGRCPASCARRPSYAW